MGFVPIYGGTTPFITTWKTDNLGASNNNEITIPTIGLGYNYTVDWGDGTPPENWTGNATHTYASPDVYEVKITGDFPRIYFNNTGDKEKIISINQWGNNLWTSMNSAFRGCINLEGTFTDIPDLSIVTDTSYMFFDARFFNGDVSNWDVSNVTNMAFMFAIALSFNRDIGNWDVSNVTNMAHMFDSATSFNANINSWDVSKVTDMSHMFYYCISFTQNINNWDVSNVIDMSYMFTRATAFNQSIGSWDVGMVNDMSYMFFDAVLFNQNIGNWDVSNVLDMSYMFTTASDFNQDISRWDVSNVNNMAVMFFQAASFNQAIGGWNVSSVTDMSNMFYEASSFDQDIGDWDVSKVTDMSLMFEGITLSVDNYDALLIGWNGRNLEFNVPFSAGNSQYCKGTIARANMITANNWQIMDGGTIGPVIDDLTDISAPNFIILPQITGLNLTGNEKYFTESNGAGIAYDAGDLVSFNDFSSYPVTLYIYDYLNLGCGSEESFQLTITSAFSCTMLSNPLDGTNDVSVDTNISWNSINDAIGYTLTIGTSSESSDILNNFDVGNVESYNPIENLPENTTIYVKVTPYNNSGMTLTCFEETFTTTQYSNSNNNVPKYFTPNNDGMNDFWIVPDPLNRLSKIIIVNRYGKLIKEIINFSEGWDGTYRNKLLPVDDYWYIIQYNSGEVLRGHFSLVR
jgi:gliding motility-associated-like protein